MSNLDFIKQLDELNFFTDVLKQTFIIIFSYYIYLRITNISKKSLKIFFLLPISAVIISILTNIIEYNIDSYCSMSLMVLLMTFNNKFCFRSNIEYTILLTIISFCFSYIIYIMSVMVAFLPVTIIQLNDNVNFVIILIIYYLFTINTFKINKFKYGIIYLNNKLKDSYINLFVFNIGAIILMVSMILNDNMIVQSRKIGITFVIVSIIMFLTIKQSFDLYYKQSLLEKDLKETKEELENKKQEIEKLEKANLEFSKTSHSLAHKQKALEYRLSQLTKLGKINEDEEIDIKNELENISEEMYKEPEDIELAKTDITSIDNMFSYMQSECIKDNIKFELQVVGNIHYMVNNLISENELEILIADHIKDAIIAINHSDNSNRSILVRIGKIDNVYSLYIYDSGIEFTKEVLDNLGKKPITTHADTGGTGMGFMNTFDTLNKTKASLIINEIGKPCEDNYTKVLIFKFDNQNEFKVNSYKNEVVV